MMNNMIKIALICILIIISGPDPLSAMSSTALVALKQAGFSDQVIQAVAREKVIETAAFTVEELIQLKKAGMTDETVEVLVTERSFMRQAQPIIYGKAVKPLNMSSVQDLIELKQAGMSDDVIQAIVVASSQRRGAEYDRAWDMLNGMGLEVKVRP
jgi:hypothetical protein